MELREAFIGRKGRFKLLELSLEAACFAKAAPLLEVGCATGEGSAHLAELGYTCVTGVDIDAEAIAQAREKFPGVSFVCADARHLPFAAGSFEGIISEAAFSVIDGKAEAAREYARVLAPGGLALLHDFAAAAESAHTQPGIPCLDGVQSMEGYRAVFEAAGFECVCESEEYGEYIGIAMSLGKAYGVPPTEVGKYIVSAFGRDGYVTDFFAHTRLTYCRMVFKRV